MLLFKKGPAWKFVKLLKKTKPFKGAKFTVVTSGKIPDRVIMGIGQMHPVQHGKITRKKAKKIASVQAWIFYVCHFLYKKGNVKSFGQEGFSMEPGQVKEARVDTDIMKDIIVMNAKHKKPTKVLRKIAKDWRKAMKKGDQTQILRSVTALNALTLLQSVEEAVTVFPIERRDVHNAISDEINALYTEMEDLAKSSVYQSAQKKGGKELTKEEFEAAKQHNELVKRFNTVLEDPKREEAIMENVLEYAKDKHVTTFILGQSHMKRMLKIAKANPEEILFLWITPKPFRPIRGSSAKYIFIGIFLILGMMLLNEVA